MAGKSFIPIEIEEATSPTSGRQQTLRELCMAGAFRKDARDILALLHHKQIINRISLTTNLQELMPKERHAK